MRNKLNLVAIAFSLAAGMAADPPPLPSRSLPRLLRTVPFQEYGSKYIRFGDLDGDGMPEALLAQVTAPGGEHKAIITCLTAIDLEGRVLWQVGKPDIRNIYFGGDFPIEIYDLDRDGRSEVIYIPDEKNVLTILDGKTGDVRKTVQLAGGHDSILFADFSGRGYAQDLVVKDRYKGFWVYDTVADFKLLWSKQDVNPGHYPIEHDFDGDGKDELLCGYTLYAHDGRELWSHPEFPQHNDAVFIDDMDGDRRVEIALATSADAVLLDPEGKVLFRKTMNHCQHALIGKFRADLPGKQVCFISREKNKSGKGYGLSLVAMYNKSGDELWKNDDTNIWSMAGSVVNNWTGNPDENFVALYSRGYLPPALIDGHGREVATFPFPPAITKQGGGPGGKDLYDDYYVQHLDVHGDEREEILVFNHKALYIYTNTALWQRPRLYNHNTYPGRQ